jgi:hypothetical protein
LLSAFASLLATVSAEVSAQPGLASPKGGR